MHSSVGGLKVAETTFNLFPKVVREPAVVIPASIAILSAAMVSAGLQIEKKSVLAQKTAAGLVIVGIIGVVTCFVMFSWTFLKASASIRTIEHRMPASAVRTRKLTESSSFVDLTERIAKIESSLELISTSPSVNLDEVVRSVEDRVRLGLTTSLIENASEVLRSSLDRNNVMTAIREAYQASAYRLEQEAIKSRKAGIYNLIIGGAVSSIGIAILAATLFMAQPVYSSSSMAELFLHYGPRLGLVLLVEGLALFFLRLYKASADDVRYYNNELTNIEQRATAYEIAASTDDEALLATVVDKSANVERNFILRKGETTISIEKARLDGASSPTEVLKVLTPLLSKISVHR